MKVSASIKSSFFAMLQRFSLMFFGLGSFLVLVRVLTEEEMGVWALFLTITSATEVARAGMIKNGLIRYLNSEPDKGQHVRIEVASIALHCIITLLLILAILLFAKPIAQALDTPLLESMLYYYIITAIFLVPFSHYVFLQQSHSDFQAVFYGYLVRQSLFFVFIIMALFTGRDFANLNMLAIFQGITLAAATLAIYFQTRKYISPGFVLDLSWVNKLWKYGRYVFSTNVSALIFSSTDHIMVASYVSTAGVAYYNTAVRVSNLLEIPSSALSEVVFPKSVRAMADGGLASVKALYERTVGTILAIAIPMSVGVILFPELIIRIIAGEKYLPAVYILQITVLYGLLQPFSRHFGNTMDSIGKPQVNFLITAIVALLNIGFNYFFIMRYGLAGAAYAHFGLLLCQFLHHPDLAFFMLKVNPFETFKYIFLFYPDFTAK
jgi:lipopolysaccharide exporter